MHRLTNLIILVMYSTEPYATTLIDTVMTFDWTLGSDDMKIF